MWALFQKEINSFFSSLTGFIVIIIFLSINGLFIWVFPGNMNILDNGQASLSPLFTIAPWVFLFLIPAITMRSFAEEKKSGTLDLLITRPLSNLQIVLGKYFASITLTTLALLPTLIYYYSVISLSSAPGNLDQGAFWGSFIGLILLAASYAAVGIFASALSDNVIISFLIAVFVCFFIYTGLEYISSLFPLGGMGNFIQNLGIEAHYRSISRGVIDTRDVIYFLSTIAIFTSLSTLKLSSRRW